MCYINTIDFHLMFLRAEKFHVKRAAKRMMCYLNEKLLLFGKESLLRPIYKNDLQNDDLSLLELGGLYTNGSIDHSGRLIVCMRDQIIFENNYTSKHFKRGLFYISSKYIEGNDFVADDNIHHHHHHHYRFRNHNNSEHQAYITTLQQKGATFIAYNIGQQRTSSISQMIDMTSASQFVLYGLPIYISAQHVCFNDYQEYVLMNFLIKLKNLYPTSYSKN